MRVPASVRSPSAIHARRRRKGASSASSLRRRFVHFLLSRGLLRTPVLLFCPGCDYETRRVPRAKGHTCDARLPEGSSRRMARRRIRRAARKSGTVVL